MAALTVLESKGWTNCGEMAEWLKAHAWKACIPQGIQGSNPCLSAINYCPHPTLLLKRYVDDTGGNGPAVG